jgi:hypothetical protein
MGLSYRYAVEAPVHYQWDADSRLPSPDPGSAPNNCGPTSVENIAHFYRDARYGIYRTRILANGYPYGATTVGEQRTMLEKRGVPAIISQPSLTAIRAFAERRTHPIILGLYMAQVPLSVAGHPFRGWHAVEVLQTATDGNAQGVLVRDPNFSPLHDRPDPTHGRRFYPNWVIQAAFVNTGGWAIIPEKAKDVSWQGRVRANAGAQIRERPYQSESNVWATARADGYTYNRNGNRLWANTYQYHWNGFIRDTSDGRYYSVKTHDGRRRFIRVGAATVTRPA